MTEQPRYAELHAHSAYSFLDGANQPAELVGQAHRLGLTGLALTDHDGLYGVVKHAQAAKEVGLPTVFGAELHLPLDALDGGLLDPRDRGALDPPTGVPDPRSTHLLVLARSPQGYRNLSAAIADAHLDAGVKGAALYRLADLADRAAGEWLVLTGCRKGAVRSALTRRWASGAGRAGGAGQRSTRHSPRRGTRPGVVTVAAYDEARAELGRLVDLFGQGSVAVEVTRTGHPYDDAVADALAALADDAGLPLVATGAVHYATPGDADLAGALAAVRARSSLDDMDGWLPAGRSAHLRSAAEMLVLHRDRPDAVATAAALADECAFDLHLLAPDLPPYPVPDGHDEASWLRELVRVGALDRYGPPDAERVPGAYAMLEHELRVIEQLHFPGYFLVVFDIVTFCAEQGILAQGRGSAANSAVCYALGVTAVDAVRHGLLFERFLAPERDGPPDIDVDIESGRREEVIQHVYARFGRRHAAQVANVISYRPRSAVRDAARALGYDAGQQDAWSKSIERWGDLRRVPDDATGDTTGSAHSARGARGHHRIVERPWGSRDRAPRVTSDDLSGIPEPVLDLAERMLRLPRHLGIHSGGMVMCDRPVVEVCPVEWARMEGRTVLQWDKEDCADAGLVKFDLLGLGMLTALRIMFEEVERHTGERLALHGLPHEDPLVYELLCAADTVGVFQVESRAQMATLPRLRPHCFYDIVVEVALIRPGPIQGQSVHPYIDRARGRQPVTFLHPRLERSLGRTKGVPLFQEQLMQMAIDVADFTPAESDRLRRAMGSKRSTERMEELRERLMTGMARNGISGAASDEIFDKLRAFADFGFPESHAYSFAFLVYASSWMKVHHPAAFYAGLLAAQPMGFYSPQSLVADARRHGLVVHRADVAVSDVQATTEPRDPREPVDPHPEVDGEGRASVDLRAKVEGPSDGVSIPAGSPLDARDHGFAVRLGLAAVRGVGEKVARALVDERVAHGPFRDLRDLARRVRLTTAQLEALATAGALRCFGVTRREALWAAGALGQEGPGTLPGVSVGVEAPTLPGMSAVELAVADVWATSVSTDTYPTQFVRGGLDAQGVLRVADVLAHEPERRVAVAGVVTHRQRPSTAAGVTFLSLEDETGILNVICTQGLWRRFQKVARTSAALVVRGRVERADDATNLLAEHLAPLSLRVPSRSRDFH
ncbi:error-prone DNA polymerase [Luteimicrobium subarcticum]|uniref:Error-prone DNA polymerase n=1 Tax=Luteimicrobium subarcticum TaxID=620910 RepID=A0A2M8W3J8_9MICO|nr:error-prone DNA polymerase [Luteimicrobium subarcticum]PJI85513.1 error-prone DNA polymerase [Luteimicrobium subarcticum]